MRKRTGLFIVASLITAAVLSAPYFVEWHLNPVEWPQHTPTVRAQKLHFKLRVADLHADSLMSARDLSERAGRGQADLPRLREGGVVLQGLGIVTKVPRGMRMDENDDHSDLIKWVAILERWPFRTWGSLIERALYLAGRATALEKAEKGRFRVVRTAADLRDVLARHRDDHGVLGGILGLEGAHALEGKLENVDRLYDAGVRSMGLAHFFDNEFAGSAHGIGKGGLTPAGRALVKKLEAMKIVVDLAHASAATIKDVLAIATRPVLVSHTGVVGTCRGPRNLDDDQLRAIGRNGGLIGIGFWSVAVCSTDLSAITRAIAHAVSVAGVDHVALGSDFDGAVKMPIDASGLVYITDAMLAAGFDEPTIKKVMGENAIAFWQRQLP